MRCYTVKGRKYLKDRLICHKLSKFMPLKVVTMVDQVTDRMSVLQESCERYDLDLVVLQRNPWINNAFKLRLLVDYLNNPSLDPEDLILVVDAYDVVITRSPDQLISRFKELGSDIVFSAEANYYFREKDLELYYWIYYPRNGSSVFHFLNSGSFMGSVKSLKSLLNTVSQVYAIDFTDDQQLAEIRSDQYVYSRFYVDSMTGVIQAGFSLRLDANQVLFGCSGGRMSVINWPAIHWIQDYLFFKFERRWLKTFWMKGGQTSSRDFTFDETTNTYSNTKTGSKPLILHLPGTYLYFKKALRRISGKTIWDKWIPLSPLTFLVTLIAYIRSMVIYRYVKLRNRGVVDLSSVFPIPVEGHLIRPNENDSTGLIQLSIYDLHTPYHLSQLRGKKVYFLVAETNSLEAFQKLGVEVDDNRVFLAESQKLLENEHLPGAILVDAIGIFANRGDITNKNLVYHPTGSLNRLLFKEPFGAFPSDNPFTIMN